MSSSVSGKYSLSEGNRSSNEGDLQRAAARVVSVLKDFSNPEAINQALNDSKSALKQNIETLESLGGRVDVVQTKHHVSVRMSESSKSATYGRFRHIKSTRLFGSSKTNTKYSKRKSFNKATTLLYASPDPKALVENVYKGDYRVRSVTTTENRTIVHISVYPKINKDLLNRHTAVQIFMKKETNEESTQSDSFDFKQLQDKQEKFEKLKDCTMEVYDIATVGNEMVILGEDWETDLFTELPADIDDVLEGDIVLFDQKLKPFKDKFNEPLNNFFRRSFEVLQKAGITWENMDLEDLALKEDSEGNIVIKLINPSKIKNKNSSDKNADEFVKRMFFELGIS